MNKKVYYCPLTDKELISQLQGANAFQAQQIKLLEEKVLLLLSQIQSQSVKKDSHNSSLPPSSDIVSKPKKGYYARSFIENDPAVKEDKTENKEFWSMIFKETNFIECIELDYCLPPSSTDEKDIFEYLGIKYISPENRS